MIIRSLHEEVCCNPTNLIYTDNKLNTIQIRGMCNCISFPLIIIKNNSYSISPFSVIIYTTNLIPIWEFHISSHSFDNNNNNLSLHSLYRSYSINSTIMSSKKNKQIKSKSPQKGDKDKDKDKAKNKKSPRRSARLKEQKKSKRSLSDHLATNNNKNTELSAPTSDKDDSPSKRRKLSTLTAAEDGIDLNSNDDDDIVSDNETHRASPVHPGTLNESTTSTKPNETNNNSTVSTTSVRYEPSSGFRPDQHSNKSPSKFNSLFHDIISSKDLNPVIPTLIASELELNLIVDISTRKVIDTPMNKKATYSETGLELSIFLQTLFFIKYCMHE